MRELHRYILAIVILLIPISILSYGIIWIISMGLDQSVFSICLLSCFLIGIIILILIVLFILLCSYLDEVLSELREDE